MQFTVALDPIGGKPIPKTLRQLIEEENFSPETAKVIQEQKSKNQMYNVFVVGTINESVKMSLLINQMRSEPYIDEETEEEVTDQLRPTDDFGVDLYLTFGKPGTRFEVRSLDLVEFAGDGTFECLIW